MITVRPSTIIWLQRELRAARAFCNICGAIGVTLGLLTVVLALKELNIWTGLSFLWTAVFLLAALNAGNRVDRINIEILRHKAQRQ